MLKIITSTLLTVGFLATFNVAAETPNDSWKNVFNFQTKMAARGNVSAQYILGEMYEEGRGVEANDAKAIEWYQKAQRNGHQDAAVRITQIKLRIAAKKQEKKAPKHKARVIKQEIVKTKPVKKPPAAKILATRKEVNPPVSKQSTVKAASKIISKKEIEETKATKPKKPRSVKDNRARAKGTHLDVNEDENPFE